MLVKYRIEIDGVMHDVPQDGLKNWDEIVCRYNRASFGSVTRSFTSEFEFVNGMYELMLELYKKDGINAKATIHLYTITNRWEWKESFVCPLDFTSASWDRYVFKISCVDSNLAALIKANKSTKFEFLVGEEIATSTPLDFDRIPMVESVNFEIIGESNDENAEMKFTFPNSSRMPAYLLNENILINGVVEFGDQEDSSDGFIVKAVKDVTLTVSGAIAFDRRAASNYDFRIGVYSSSDLTGDIITLASNYGWVSFLGDADTPQELPTKTNSGDPIMAPGGMAYVKSTDTIWVLWLKDETVIGDPYEWIDTGLSEDEFMRTLFLAENTVELKAGEYLYVRGSYNGQRPTINILKQEIKISWAAEGGEEVIETIAPKTLCKKLLDRMSMESLDIDVEFSDRDPRLANTYLMAAESIREIPNARIYSSFNEFTDWMSTVFGYTYYLGELRRGFAGICDFNGPIGYVTDTPDPESLRLIIDEARPNATLTKIYFHRMINAFVAFDEGIGRLCLKWPKFGRYHDSSFYNDLNNVARRDMLFRDNTSAYEINDKFEFVPYKGDLTKIRLDKQSVIFVHRSEIFNPDSEVRTLKNVRDVSYSVDSGCIYSAVTIGYDKKDYDGFNGRDEFNFSNSYSTGHDINEKTLSLISKYRADSYGIEFAVQKRSEKTTDGSSDNDIFFILATTNEDGKLVPDRSVKIENAISDKVFNGAFSPMACLKANAGMIGAQERNLHLDFASSTGNSDIVIDGVSMSDNFDLGEPYITCGQVSFTTDDIDDIVQVNQLVEFENGGIFYRGYISEASFKYAVNEAVDYTLLVKDFELCF